MKQTEIRYKTQWEKDYILSFARMQYAEGGNLAIMIYCKEDGNGYQEPYGTLTVNLYEPTDGNRAYLDVNNIPRDLISLLLQKGVFKYTNKVCRSGWVEYPEVEFNQKWLEAIT